ncbi:MAG: hypothetical protein HN764_05820 [Gammaproteobacteria bacterium]|jgi:hypothetical protein|nr:hypothetical protein [Gammaproteobacteria bacterium]
MSLLLDALKNASARKDEIAKESNQTTKDSQHRESSQKLAASFFRNSKNNSLISNPLLITVLTLAIIISGTYWWQLHSTSSVSEENKSQPVQVASQETSTPAEPAIPGIVTAAVELESINSLVDQMQSEHASIMANEERKRKELETTLLEKTKALKIAEQQVLSLNRQKKQLSMADDKTNTELEAKVVELKSIKQEHAAKLLALQTEQSSQANTLATKTKSLKTAEQQIASLNTQLEESKLERIKLETELTAQLASLESSQQQQSKKIDIANKKQKELLTSLDTKTQALTSAEQSIIKLNTQIKENKLLNQQLEGKLSDAATINEQLKKKYNTEQTVTEQQRAELAMKLSESNKSNDLAVLQVNKLQQEKVALANQVESLQEENKGIRAEQLLAGANVAKIQKIQDSIFLQLKDEYKNALGKIKRYESDIEQAKSLAVKENSPNPKDGIPLKLDMQLGAIGNQ